MEVVQPSTPSATIAPSPMLWHQPAQMERALSLDTVNVALTDQSSSSPTGCCAELLGHSAQHQPSKHLCDASTYHMAPLRCLLLPSLSSSKADSIQGCGLASPPPEPHTPDWTPTCRCHQQQQPCDTHDQLLKLAPIRTTLAHTANPTHHHPLAPVTPGTCHHKASATISGTVAAHHHQLLQCDSVDKLHLHQLRCCASTSSACSPSSFDASIESPVSPCTPSASTLSFPAQLQEALQAAAQQPSPSTSDTDEEEEEDECHAAATQLPWAAAPGPFCPGFNGVVTLHSKCPQAMRRQRWGLNDYSNLELLYRGYKSHVYQATCRYSGSKVVLKVYQLSELNQFHKHLVVREHNIHSRVDHPNIITLYCSFQEADNIVLVLEHATHGDLYGALRSTGTTLTERQAVAVLRPVLLALEYLHAQGLVHRDIKPENILITADGTFKLADFGVSIDCRKERPVTRAGTLDYMSPEVLRCPNKVLPTDNKDRADLAYGEATDVWALGVLAYELMTGLSPFLAACSEMCEANVMHAEPNYPSTMPLLTVDFLQACLLKDPRQRPTMHALLHHPWMKCATKRRAPRASNGNAAAPAPAPMQQQ